MKRLKALRELKDRLGAEVFLVGGAVRDLVRHQKPHDLDVVVRGVAPSDFEGFLREHGDLRLVGKSFGVYLFTPEGSNEGLEIAFPRTEASTGSGHKDFLVQSDPSISIQEDSARRDFTLNALYLPLEALGEDGSFRKEAVLDFHNGLMHMQRRLIVAVGSAQERLLEDPLRMLRAMVLVARTGYRLEGNTFGAIKKNAQLLKSVAPERIRDEFTKLMESGSPSRGFKTMARTGILEVVFPELAACVGCGQNPKYHSYPVFEHLIYATDAACSITDRLDVRFGTLCHDLGKAPTRAVRPGGAGPDDVSFHNHEIVSTRLTYEFLRRLRYPREFTEQVVHLVRHHQYKYDRAWTDKAVRRFIRNAVITREDLGELDKHPQFLLRQADRMGNAMKADVPITQKQRDFQRRIQEVYQGSSAHSLRDLRVNGEDLKTSLGIPAGPAVGKVIRFLFEVVEEFPEANNREELLRRARKFLEEDANGDHQTDGESPSASAGSAEQGD